MNHPVPFIKASNVMVPKKLAKEAPDLEEAIEEEDDAEVVEPVEADDEEVDFSKDKYIKQPKAKKGTKKTAKAAPTDSDDGKPKGRGKPKKGKK